MEITINHIDTACCLIKIDEVTILTDPVFDEKGKYYHHGYGAISKKTSNPGVNNDSLPDIDLLLLTHPQHKDNFDRIGREVAKKASIILSTKQIEKMYDQGKGMIPWETYTFTTPNRSELTITATPAKHHPKWLPEFFSGKVIGFIIKHSGFKKAIYITGDTIFYKGIEETVKRFPEISIALIHVGSAQFRYLTGFGQYTMNRKGFIKCVKTIKPDLAVPIHNNGWTHFKENDEGIKKELENYSDESKITRFLPKGVETKIEIE